jgi:hypothetical protein
MLSDWSNGLRNLRATGPLLGAMLAVAIADLSRAYWSGNPAPPRPGARWETGKTRQNRVVGCCATLNSLNWSRPSF